jgi:4-hydroxy-2-oxoheptanedioate aldolase
MGKGVRNRLKQILASGRPALGCWIGFSDPYAVEMTADIGFDWLLIDMEHFPLGRESLRTILMACKGSGSVPVVRLQSSLAEHFQTALDLGAQGIMVPMVSSAADAASAVRACRYPPLGRRGLGPVRASRYTESIEEYRAEANQEIALIVQIETPEAVDNAPEIIKSAGIDGAFIGNGDLASFINGSGQVHSQNIEDIVDRLIEMACDAALPVGLCAWSTEECNAYMERGARLLTIGSDLSFLAAQARRTLSETRRSLETVRHLKGM